MRLPTHHLCASRMFLRRIGAIACKLCAFSISGLNALDRWHANNFEISLTKHGLVKYMGLCMQVGTLHAIVELSFSHWSPT